ncbi:MAG: LysR family transcriptional regulator [Chloroflexi bacterium]|nr:LysR family transcriptional regulator [Chloroflexota bacterium]
MQLAQLEALLQAARLGSVSRAADALFVSQPALTARLNALEEELGSVLLVRGRRGARLTDAGRAFLPYAARAVETADEGRALVARLERGESGELAIGAAPAISAYALPPALRDLQKRFPDLRLSVRSGHSEEVLGLVLADAVQVGLTRALLHPEIESIPLYQDELVLVCDSRHRFAKDARIRPAAISGERLIMFDRTSSYHELTSAMLREAGVAPGQLMELDNAEAAKKMVEEGLGIALLPRTAVLREIADRSLRVVSVIGFPTVKRQIVALRRRDSGEPLKPLAALLDLLSDGGQRRAQTSATVTSRAARTARARRTSVVSSRAPRRSARAT